MKLMLSTSQDPKKTCDKGFTLFELLVALAITSSVFLALFSNFRALERPLSSGAELTLGFFRLVRAGAISHTESRVVVPVTTNRLQVKSGTNCDVARDADAFDTDLVLSLPAGVYFNSTDWDVCFTSRGFIDNSEEFSLRDRDGKQLNIETYLGGTAKIS